jgi:hypothetical protein
MRIALSEQVELQSDQSPVDQAGAASSSDGALTAVPRGIRRSLAK